jgi:hypothetical protein
MEPLLVQNETKTYPNKNGDKTPTEDPSCSNKPKAPLQRLKSNLVLRRQSSSSRDDNDEDDDNFTEPADNRPTVCAICLKEYTVGDEIGWSHNPDCNHAFHYECILEWLSRHDECPCCRNSYIHDENNQIEQDVESQFNTTTSPTSRRSVPPLGSDSDVVANSSITFATLELLLYAMQELSLRGLQRESSSSSHDTGPEVENPESAITRTESMETGIAEADGMESGQAVSDSTAKTNVEKDDSVQHAS